MLLIPNKINFIRRPHDHDPTLPLDDPGERYWNKIKWSTYDKEKRDKKHMVEEDR